MSTLKVPDMSQEQSKHWLNNIQYFKNIKKDKKLQKEIDKLTERKRKEENFSEEDQLKLEAAVFEKDERDKRNEEETEEAEQTKPSLKQRMGLTLHNSVKKAPVAILNAFHYLLMGFGIFSFIMIFWSPIVIFKNIPMFWVAFGAYFFGNLLKFFADLKSKRLNKERAQSITETLEETVKEKIPVDVGEAGAWISSQERREAATDTGETAL